MARGYVSHSVSNAAPRAYWEGRLCRSICMLFRICAHDLCRKCDEFEQDLVHKTLICCNPTTHCLLAAPMLRCRSYDLPADMCCRVHGRVGGREKAECVDQSRIHDQMFGSPWRLLKVKQSG